VRIPWIRQRDVEGATLIGAKSTSKRGTQLNGATFIEISDSGDILRRIDARQANLEDGRWVVQDAVEQHHGEAPEQLARLEIKSSLTPEVVEEKLARPETVPFFELPAKMRAAWSFGLNGNGFGMQFHSLFALPMLLVAMTLIAATVSMRFARMGQSATMILGGVLAGFLLYVMSVLVRAFGTAGIVPPVVAAWIPVTVAMFFGVTFLLYREDG
jgi:lipopolysaccharide export system permease protein